MNLIEQAIDKVLSKYTEVSQEPTEPLNSNLPNENSLGQPIADNEEALKNFWNWFGDSKAVDSKGRPLVCFHATNSDAFQNFDKARIGTNQGSVLGPGFYFSNCRYSSAENIYGNKTTFEVYLKIENPMTTEKLERQLDKIVRLFVSDNADQRVIDLQYPYIKPKLSYLPTISDLLAGISEKRNIPYADLMKELGFDGVIYEEQLVVFEPNQIKSVENKGTFNSNSDSIYESIDQVIPDVLSKHTLLESEDNLQELRAYAGSRVDYNKPAFRAIGSGEGNQSHGWGFYYALDPKVADNYRVTFTLDQLYNITYKGNEYGVKDGDIYQTLKYFAKSSLSFEENKHILLRNLERDLLQKSISQEEYNNQKEFIEQITEDDVKAIQVAQNYGQLHEVEIPEFKYLLDEQEMLIDQSQYVQDILTKVNEELNLGIVDSGIRGKAIYDKISDKLGSDKKASNYLYKKGIKGITYDGRRDGRCFVIFNPKDVTVLSKRY